MSNDPNDVIVDPTLPLGDFMNGFGLGSLPSMPSNAVSSSNAATRIGFSTGSFSGGSGMGFNVKNILTIGIVALIGLYLYKKIA